MKMQVNRGLLLAILLAPLLAACSGPSLVAKTRGMILQQQGESYYHMYGFNEQTRKFYTGALELLDSAAKGLPKDGGVFLYRGYCRERLGDRAGTLKDFSEAIALEPYDPTNWSERGFVFSEYGNYDKAFEDYEQAIRLASGVSTAKTGGSGEPSNNVDRSAKAAEGHGRRNAILANAYAGLGRCERHMKKWKESRADLDRAVQVGRAAFYYRTRADYFRAHGDIDEMYRDLDKAESLYPHDPETYAIRGFMEFILASSHAKLDEREQSYYQRAIRDFKIVLLLSRYRNYQAPYVVILGTEAARFLNDAGTASEFLNEGITNFHLPVATTAGGEDAQVADAWPAPIIDVAGKNIDRLTEAHCYVGMTYLMKHDKPLAAQHFLWVIAHGNFDFVEHDIASEQIKDVSDVKDLNAEQEVK
jgi:tetratricopeptide (TPR) repeat protein